jgi:hypothetical protein
VQTAGTATCKAVPPGHLTPVDTPCDSSDLNQRWRKASLRPAYEFKPVTWEDSRLESAVNAGKCLYLTGNSTTVVYDSCFAKDFLNPAPYTSAKVLLWPPISATKYTFLAVR